MTRIREGEQTTEFSAGAEIGERTISNWDPVLSVVLTSSQLRLAVLSSSMRQNSLPKMEQVLANLQVRGIAR
jgi:hypothetical protein